jgi:hypothetical protein
VPPTRAEYARARWLGPPPTRFRFHRKAAEWRTGDYYLVMVPRLLALLCLLLVSVVAFFIGSFVSTAFFIAEPGQPSGVWALPFLLWALVEGVFTLWRAANWAFRPTSKPASGWLGAGILVLALAAATLLSAELSDRRQWEAMGVSFAVPMILGNRFARIRLRKAATAAAPVVIVPPSP